MALSIRTRRRSCVMAIVAIGIALVVVLASCVGTKEPASARSVVDDYVAALNDDDLEAAAETTSYPNAAKDTLEQVWEGLSPGEATFRVTQFMELGATSSYFTLSALWNFGEDRDWTYQVQGSVRKLSVGWRISWDPEVVAPMLGDGSVLKFDRSYTGIPVVLDHHGGVMMTEQTINSIVLDPSQMPDPVDTTNRLAEAIAPVAPLITGESMRADMEKNPGEKVTAVRLRDGDFAYLESRFQIPGVVVEKEPTLIMS
ncbi:MAG: penicillin-binding protein, partial [Rhodococcus sp.]|nr:penicillin-binding protein [Rhodococcus sp. (in: high G+C Gram-positive bacteria)]